MSINVTVTGNPVNIKRGKMVTVDPNYCKKEFEKRRIMRLEQVRQQSKNIAEDVRNKVRIEKERQLKQIEEEGKQKLKNWQNRKLLELHTQFQEAVKELGNGCKEAEKLQDEADDLAEQDERNNQAARERAQVAATALQQQKEKESRQKHAVVERKKLTREVENARSALVTSLNRNKTKLGEPSAKKTKHKAAADISIKIPGCTSDSDQSIGKEGQTPSVANGENVDVFSSNSTEDSLPTEDSGPRSLLEPCDKHTKGHKTPSTAVFRNTRDDRAQGGICLTNPETCADEYQPATSKEACTVPQVQATCCRSSDIRRIYEPPLDTRISDRIRQRQLLSTPEEPQIDIRYSNICVICRKCRIPVASTCVCSKKTCDVCNTEINNSPKLCADCKRLRGSIRTTQGEPDKDDSRSNARVGDLNQVKYSDFEGYRHLNEIQLDSHLKPNMVSKDVQTVDEISKKPPIKLRHLSDDKSSGSKIDSNDLSKVHIYDHKNRFHCDKSIPSTTFVNKIKAEDIEIGSTSEPSSTAELLQKTKEAEMKARIRGQRALEKEKVQRDYEEIMKKLPLLHKQKKTSTIGKDKQEYHMSDDRLKEKERLRQQKMENAYNKLFPDLKPAIVTLPKTNQQSTQQKENVAPVHSINVGEWDVDFDEPKMFTAQEVQEIIQAYTNQNPKYRQEKLKNLLKSLKVQKEQLITEIRKLPVDDSVNELINDLNSFSEEEMKKDKDKVKRKRPVESDFDSSAGSETSEKVSIASKERKAKSPRKKAKKSSSRKVLILQNTSTQTTPKKTADADVDTNEQVTVEDPTGKKPLLRKELDVPAQSVKECCKTKVPCKCYKNKSGSEESEEVCQILIKLDEKDVREVIIKAKDQETKVLSPKGSPNKPKKPTLESKESRKIDDREVKEKRKDFLNSGEARTLPKRTTEDIIRQSSTKQLKPQSTPRDLSEDRSRSWRHNLSKNSISSSSTSYMSPPEFHKVLKSNHSSQNSKASLYCLRKKPQQTNMASLPHSVESQRTKGQKAHLLEYVTKLLGMSRASIENLSISSVSTVPTPNQSVIEVESNIPYNQIEELMKQFNEKIIETAKDLSYSPSVTPCPNNTSVSSSGKETKVGSDVVQSNKQSVGSISDEIQKSIMMTYSHITDSCSKRIENLSSMINRLREEKDEMLKNPPLSARDDSKNTGDKDTSTAYMELPAEESAKSSSSPSFDEEEIYKKLLEIDMSLANKLRKYNNAKVNAEDALAYSQGTNEEIMERLERLRNTRNVNVDRVESNDYISVLDDIPQLPKLEPQSESRNGNGRRPPPSKGLVIAKNLNQDIFLVPHELSTIQEADSQISTKAGPSPETNKNICISDEKETLNIIYSPVTGFSPISCHHTSQETSSDNTKDKETSTSSKCVKFVDELMKPRSPKDTTSSTDTQKFCDNSTCEKVCSSSTEDVDALEAMLKSIGMEWAIPTLHKTKEALALSSSSSSIDLSSSKGHKNACLETDTCLKGLLVGKLWEHSNLKAEEATDVSTDSRPKSQRTSTPVVSNKSINNTKSRDSKLMFSDTDLSSVRHDS